MSMSLFATFLSFILVFYTPTGNASMKHPAERELNIRQHFLEYDPSSEKTLDHTKWQFFLSQYLKKDPEGISRLDYDTVSPQDKKILNLYIQYLKNIPLKNYNRDEQCAYWINLYNASVVQLVLSHYPLESLDDIKLSFKKQETPDPWHMPLVKKDHYFLSLHEIKHTILRQIYGDPRIHYVLNKGTLGSPNLQDIPLNGKNLSKMMDKAAYEFVNSPRGVQIIDNQLLVNKMYLAYRIDFGGSDKQIIRHIQHYANPKLYSALMHFKTIDKTLYNWQLNTKKHHLKN